jgi:lipid A 4'-phosphatase
MAATTDRPAKPGDFGMISAPRTISALAASFAFLSLIFLQNPMWDRDIARLFFDAAACDRTARAGWCKGFVLAYQPHLVAFRELAHSLITLAMAAIVIFGIYRLARRKAAFDDVGLRITALLITAYVGPLLIVNKILKEHMGRPRPWHTTDFGGDLSFVPAWHYSEACLRNCSFVSGEAAGAAFLLCATLLTPRRWRWHWVAAVLPVSLAMASLRVAFGAHFVSDVVLGYLLTLLVFSLVAFGVERLFALRRTAKPA